MDARLAKIYYSPKGYSKGITAVKELANAAKVTSKTAKQWLVNQALQPPAEVWRLFAEFSTPSGTPFLPHDTLGQGRGRKTYKYALTVVDVASRYKTAEALSSKESAEVAKALEKIYRREHKNGLRWPQLLQVDPGREFMGAVTKAMENHKTAIRPGRVIFIGIRR